MRDRSLTLCTCVHRLKSPSFQNVFDRFGPEIQTKCLFFSLTARQSCWRSASFATPICMQRMSSACKCLEYLWIPRIEADAGYHQWPKWDKNDKLQTAPLGDFYYWGREARPCTVRVRQFPRPLWLSSRFTNWRKHLFGLDEKYDARRLEVPDLDRNDGTF